MLNSAWIYGINCRKKYGADYDAINEYLEKI